MTVVYTILFIISCLEFGISPAERSSRKHSDQAQQTYSRASVLVRRTSRTVPIWSKWRLCNSKICHWLLCLRLIWLVVKSKPFFFELQDEGQTLFLLVDDAFWLESFGADGQDEDMNGHGSSSWSGRFPINAGRKNWSHSLRWDWRQFFGQWIIARQILRTRYFYLELTFGDSLVFWHQ